jgi:hypothetical protein
MSGQWVCVVDQKDRWSATDLRRAGNGNNRDEGDDPPRYCAGN